MKTSKIVIIFIISLFFSVIFIDESGVGVTLPKIQETLQASDYALQWFMNAFFLPLGALVMIAGRMGDFFGFRKTFLYGVWIFCLGSLLCGLAFFPSIMIMGRVIQGIGAALMIANYAVLIDLNVNLAERGEVLGTSVSLSSIFLAIGPLIGGFLAHYINWRFIFLINIPVCLLIHFLSIKYIIQDHSSKKMKEFPILSSVIFLICISVIIISLMNMQNTGLDRKNTFLLISGFLILIAFLFLQKISPKKLFSLFHFRNKIFFSANCILFLIQIPVMSLIYIALWFETDLHLDPFIAGLCLLPAGIPILFCGRFSGKLADKQGFHYPMLYGAILVFIGMVAFTFLMPYQNYFYVLIPLTLYGIGAPLIISPAIRAVMSSVSVDYLGEAAGIFNTSRQLGATVCFALFGLSIELSGHVFEKLTLSFSNSYVLGMGVVTAASFICMLFAIYIYTRYRFLKQG